MHYIRSVVLDRPRWTPAHLSDRVAWFRYGRGIISASDALSQWDDAFGFGRHLKQSSGGAQPDVQSDGSILFSAGADFLQTDAFTFNQPCTVYWLLKQVTWTSGRRIYDGLTLNSGSLRQGGTTPELGLIAGALYGADASLALDTYGVVAAVFSGSNSVLQINNNAPTTGDAGSGNPGGHTLGAGGNASSFGNIQAKEGVLVSGAHDTAHRARVMSYLARIGNLSI